MNRPELFVKSVDILVDAFQRGKLKNLSTCNCAVGNLISYRKGNYVDDELRDNWHDIIFKYRQRYKMTKYPKSDVKPKLSNLKEHLDMDEFYGTDGVKEGLKELRSTEYDLNEIQQIEAAFENVSSTGVYPSSVDHVENGLIRSIKVLGKIHKIPAKTVNCMIKHVENKTYKFSYKFKEDLSKVPYEGTACPMVKSLKK